MSQDSNLLTDSQEQTILAETSDLHINIETMWSDGVEREHYGALYNPAQHIERDVMQEVYNQQNGVPQQIMESYVEFANFQLTPPMNQSPPVPDAGVDLRPQIPNIGMTPSSTNWPGQFGFEAGFDKPLSATKNAAWMYSAALDRLYVDCCKACPINFSCMDEPPENTYIRAIPVFSCPKDAQCSVKRCPNHSQPADKTNLETTHAPLDHLIRCSSNEVYYDTCQPSGRYSVTVRYVQPQAGTNQTQVFYEFMCFNSCVGGLNRRPIVVVFQLEHQGVVVGRKAVPIKVCACPGRDCKNDEKTVLEKNHAPQRSLSRQSSVCSTTNEKVGAPQNKRRRRNQQAPYHLEVQKKEDYDMLKKILDALEYTRNHTGRGIQRQMSGESRPSTSGAARPVLSRMNSVGNCNVSPAVKIDVTESGECELTFSQDNPRCDTTNVDQLESWLFGYGLQHYAPILNSFGYSTIEELHEANLTDLEAMGVSSADSCIIWTALSKITKESEEEQLPDSQTSTTDSEPSQQPCPKSTKKIRFANNKKRDRR